MANLKAARTKGKGEGEKDLVFNTSYYRRKTRFIFACVSAAIRNIEEFKITTINLEPVIQSMSQFIYAIFRGKRDKFNILSLNHLILSFFKEIIPL
ncbi:hypothetical protein ACFLTO_01570 [Chloroflexota bacterium]